MIDILLKNYDLEDEHEIVSEIVPKGYNIAAKHIAIPDIKNFPDKTKVTITGFIDSFSAKPFGKRLQRITAKVYKDGHSISIFWISSNQKYKKVLFSLQQQSPQGVLLQITGKISSFTGHDGKRIVQLEQPDINPLNVESSQLEADNLLIPEPMYVLKEKTTRHQIKHAFREIIPMINDLQAQQKFLPIELEKKLQLKPLKQSLKYMHGFIPIKAEKLEEFLTYPDFYKRVRIEKIWKTILNSALSHKEKEIPSICLTQEDVDNLKKLTTKLPFELTKDQKSAIWELLKVFSTKTGSKSLVYGDVGSGKTLVSLFIAYILYKKGYQVAIITPTSILAKQHHEEAISLFGKKGLHLLHSKTRKPQKDKIVKALKENEPAIIIGTTSVNSLDFSNLKAVFIDEEQKMGVAAKEKLYQKSNQRAHLIFMTATPIPRTLAASVFMNFHVFQIKTKPKNRKQRITKLFNFRDTQEVQNIKERITQKEQSLVIVPSITSDDMANVKDTMKKYKKIFPEASVASINGKMKKDEVEKIIEEYMKGKYDILIATTMVDSGFSNKNLSHVFIEGADRFGISQLHQIRGRCGRGEKQGYCYLIPGKQNLKETTKKRLEYVISSEDGFKLSEYDIQLRGSGDLSGEEQSGKELNFLDYINEIEVIKEYIKSKVISSPQGR